MMHQPVIDQAVLDFMRTKVAVLDGPLGELEAQAHEKGIPVIPHETVAFLQQLVAMKQPQQILEIGTAIGFSAALMASVMPASGHVTTIDRYELMYERAAANFKQLGLTDKITQKNGDAADILPTLTGSYDLIFMDSAKSKYVEFLPDCLRLLAPGGVLLIDDVLQGGTIFLPKNEIEHRNRGIHRKLNELFETVLPDKTLYSSLLPLGDGVLMITKR